MAPPIGHRLVRLSETTSTIDVARVLVGEGAAHGTVILAERQTAGRGRRGRSWTTLSGKSMAATVVLSDKPEPDCLGLAGLAAALAVVRAAKARLALNLHTRWPNDVLAGDRKLAGSLAELHHGVLLLSLGLNINGVEIDLPPHLRDTATTLEIVAGHRLDCESVIAAVLSELDAAWLTLLAEPANLIREWEALDITANREVVVTNALGRETHGRALGIDCRGALRLLKRDGEELRCDAGDVTLTTGPAGAGGAA